MGRIIALLILCFRAAPAMAVPPSLSLFG